MTGGSIVGGGGGWGVGVVGEQPATAINAIETHHVHAGRTKECKLCTNDSKDWRKSVRGGPSLPRPGGPVPRTRPATSYGKLADTPSGGNGIIRMADRSCTGARLSARVDPATIMNPTSSPGLG